MESIVGLDTVINDAYKAVSRFGWSEEERRGYESYLKYERDAEAILEQKFDDGLAKGLREGKAEGKAEGLAEGEAKGLAEGEHRAKLETAKNLKALGIPIDLIIQATGLTEAEIISL